VFLNRVSTVGWQIAEAWGHFLAWGRASSETGQFEDVLNGRFPPSKERLSAFRTIVGALCVRVIVMMMFELYSDAQNLPRRL